MRPWGNPRTLIGLVFEKDRRRAGLPGLLIILLGGVSAAQHQQSGINVVAVRDEIDLSESGIVYDNWRLKPAAVIFDPLERWIIVAIEELGHVVTRPDNMKAGKLADRAAVFGQLLQPLKQDALQVRVVHVGRVSDDKHMAFSK